MIWLIETVRALTADRRANNQSRHRRPEHCPPGRQIIGSHLCRALIARGDRVTAIDNPSTGHRENLSDLLTCPEFRLIVGGITTHRPCRRGALRGSCTRNRIPRSIANTSGAAIPAIRAVPGLHARAQRLINSEGSTARTGSNHEQSSITTVAVIRPPSVPISMKDSTVHGQDKAFRRADVRTTATTSPPVRRNIGAPTEYERMNDPKRTTGAGLMKDLDGEVGCQASRSPPRVVRVLLGQDFGKRVIIEHPLDVLGDLFALQQNSFQ
ncbi:hypothetical protein AB0E01_44345 [Nocardia vinacea]|uniref:hypothetical protein n=1 Tax=Nocardia vinacea TaxID=96468 RepID=UPI00340C0561